MQDTMSYTMSFFFAYHRLRPLKWLARVFHDEPCISHCIFIYSHKSYMILSVHCAAVHDVRACAAPSPTHTVTINIYHFKGSVVHRPPLVHPDCPLELFCIPTVPLRGHATTVLHGVGSAASAETPFSSPLHGQNKTTCCTQIHTGRLSDIH